MLFAVTAALQLLLAQLMSSAEIGDKTRALPVRHLRLCDTHATLALKQGVLNQLCFLAS